MSYYDLKDILGDRLVDMDKLFPPQSHRYVLWGVDRIVEDLSELLSETDAAAVETLALQLGSRVYVVMEDPDDGYRSSMGYAFVSNTHEMMNKFPLPTPAVASKAEDNDQTLYQLSDAITGEIIVQVGTDYSDSYYPSFVASYKPEGAYFNQDWWKSLGVLDIDFDDWYSLVSEINDFKAYAAQKAKK